MVSLNVTIKFDQYIQREVMIYGEQITLFTSFYNLLIAIENYLIRLRISSDLLVLIS